MRRFNAILLLLVGMARPPTAAAKKKAKKAAATSAKVAVPDEVPVVDPFNTSDKNTENFDTSVQAVRDWSGHAMQQQAGSWLSTNLTSMMNQLKGSVRNDSAGTSSGMATFADVAAAFFAFFFAAAVGGRAMPISSRRMALNLRILQKAQKK
jgi:hypothetical protein